MSNGHHVVVTWSGTDSDSQPIVQLLQRQKVPYAVEMKNGLTQLEITVQAESLRALRDSVDALLVQLSSLED